ncbi:MAG: stage V sporulation protein AE [Clostridia bacterium]|nr:stage V sporulation protein AE [Clostridia bacterium]
MDWIKLLNAFWVGGLFCVIAQLLIDYTKMTPARIMVSYVMAGVILTAMGIYEPIVNFAGNGATTPIIGFGYTLAKGVAKAIDEKGFIGILTGGVMGAAGGISAAVFFGLLFSLLCKPKAKNPKR